MYVVCANCMRLMLVLLLGNCYDCCMFLSSFKSFLNFEIDSYYSWNWFMELKMKISLSVVEIDFYDIKKQLFSDQ